MNKIVPNKFGLAIGVVSVLFYVGCILLMQILSDHTLSVLANSLLHGLDVSTLLRSEIPITESLIGLIITFILGWLFGLLTAFFYNSMIKQISQRN